MYTTIELSENLKNFFEKAKELLTIDVTDTELDNDYQTSAIYFLNQAILAGEFYPLGDILRNSYFEKIKREITILRETIIAGDPNRFSTATKKNEAVTLKINIDRLNKRKKYLSRVIHIFENFVDVIETRLDDIFEEHCNVYSHDDILLDSPIKTLSEFLLKGENEREEHDAWYCYFLLNIDLALEDLNLSCTKQSAEELEEYRYFFKSNNEDSSLEEYDLRTLHKVLEQKCLFLLYKTYKREGKMTEANTLISQLKGTCFEGFVNKIEQHYLETPNYQKKDVQWGLNLKLTEIHEQNKYCRITKDADYAATLLNNLPKGYDNKFDEIAISSARNLLQNTIYRIEFEKEKEVKYSTLITQMAVGKIEFIEKKIEEIKEKQRLTKIYDYYPYLQIIKLLDEFVAFLRTKKHQDMIGLGINNENQAKILESIDWLEKQMAANKSDSVYAIYDEYLKRASYLHAQPLYLLKNECMIEFMSNEEVGKIPIYLDSAYILPDRYDLLKEANFGAVGRFRASLRSLRNRIEVEFSVATFEEKNKIDINDAKVALAEQLTGKITESEATFDTKAKDQQKAFAKELEGKEMRAVTVLAMFITVAIYVLGQTKMFEGRTLFESLALTFAFGACLLGFNFIFIYFNKQNAEQQEAEVFEKLQNKMIGIIIVLLLLSSAIVYCDSKFFVDRIENKQVKVDSVNHKLDSLIKVSLKIKHDLDSMNHKVPPTNKAGNSLPAPTKSDTLVR